MRVILIIATLMSSTCVVADNKPIISASRIYSIFADSVNLAIDGLKFANQKTEASLSREMRGTYTQYVAKFTSYCSMVAAAPPVKAAGYWFTVASTWVSEEWAKVELRINPKLDKLVVEFETRYPKSKWLIGGKLIDRILLLIWMLWLFGAAVKMVRCRRRRRVIRK